MMIEYAIATKEIVRSEDYRNLPSQGSQLVREGLDEKRLVRAIDKRILPLLIILYFLQFMDKIILNVCCFLLDIWFDAID